METVFVIVLGFRERVQELLQRGTRFFPADFLRRVVRERLHRTPDEMDGDHLPMLGHPMELADRLEAYWSHQQQLTARHERGRYRDDDDTPARDHGGRDHL